MKFIVIGSGSAANKFVKALLEKKHSVFIYQHRKDLEIPEGCFPLTSLQDLSTFNAGIIASPTQSHLKYASVFLKQQLPTLIEKPLSDSLTGVSSLMRLAQKNKTVLRVGFNLRFLPVVEKIKALIEKKKLGKILHADLYVGQYLPEWRPWLDYRDNYSSSYALGGGVSLDLIHEVDLALHFFSGIKLHSVISGKLGDLDITTEDYVLFQTKKMPYITVHMDYLNHVKTREWRIVGTDGSIRCDVFNKYFEYRSKTGKQEIITDPTYFDIPQSFVTELESFIRGVKTNKEIVNERTLGIDALRVSVKGRTYVQR